VRAGRITVRRNFDFRSSLLSARPMAPGIRLQILRREEDVVALILITKRRDGPVQPTFRSVTSAPVNMGLCAPDAGRRASGVDRYRGRVSRTSLEQRFGPPNRRPRARSRSPRRYEHATFYRPPDLHHHTACRATRFSEVAASAAKPHRRIRNTNTRLGPSAGRAVHGRLPCLPACTPLRAPYSPRSPDASASAKDTPADRWLWVLKTRIAAKDDVMYRDPGWFCDGASGRAKSSERQQKKTLIASFCQPGC